MKFKLEIKMGNAVMDHPLDVSLAVKNVAIEILRGREHGVVMDANGNKVGKWEFK